MKKSLLYILAIFLFACDAKKEMDNKLPFQLRVIELSSPTKSSLRGISVLDSNTAWVSGAEGSIIKIDNGGAKLLIVKSPDTDQLDYRDVHAFSEDSLIVISSGYPARVYSSSNSGKDWHLLYENMDSSAFLNSIHFKSESNGLILGDRIDGYHFILKTNNAGKQWQRIDSTLLPEPLELEHGFAASGSCIALSKNGRYMIGLGGEESRVMVENEDTSWTAYSTGLGDSLATSGIYSICAANDLIMVVGGDYKEVDQGYSAFLSMDGGKNWKERGQLNGYRSVVDHHKPTDVWLAGGTNGIEISWDRGAHWSMVSQLSINTLQFDDSSHLGYAASSDGKIYRLELRKQSR